MKTHLMVKRNWLVSLFTRYNYSMACNSKKKYCRKGINLFIGVNEKGIDGEVLAEFQGNEYIGDCKNCISTKIYQGESK